MQLAGARLMEHHLQKAWADAEVEAAYLQRIEAMVHGGDLDAAAEVLLADLATLGTPLADLCCELSEEAADIAGWEEIGDAIVQYEGEPVTAVHIVMSNDADLVFEDKSLTHQPLIEVVFYTDELLTFSTLSREDLLAESLRSDEPIWYGQGEDIEVYLEINGLGQLNTALLHHKRQYYFRDQMHVLDEANGLAADTTPLPYIEYRLAAMFRAVRYHQAVKSLIDGYGLYGNLPVIVGMHNMRLEIGSVYVSKASNVVQLAKTARLAVKIKRNVEVAPAEFVGTNLRQKMVQEEEQERPSFLRRLFGRR
jgi:hypothetical protein